MSLTRAAAVFAVVVAIAAWGTSAPALAQASAAASITTGEATFEVWLGGTSIGTVRSDVVRTGDGWTVTTSGAVGAPFNLTTRRAELGYTTDWQPQSLTLDLAAPGEQVIVHGGFTVAGEDRVEIVNEQRQVVFVIPTVSNDALLLSDSAPGSYEALAAWLADAAVGAVRHAYLVPNREITVRVEGVDSDRVRLASRTVSIRRCRVAFQDPAGPHVVDAWVYQGRLLRLDVPATSLSLRRADVTGW